MNYRRLCERIRNLDHLYLAWDRFANEAMNEQEPEAKRGLQNVANRIRRTYVRLVADRRRVKA